MAAATIAGKFLVISRQTPFNPTNGGLVAMLLPTNQPVSPGQWARPSRASWPAWAASWSTALASDVTSAFIVLQRATRPVDSLGEPILSPFIGSKAVPLPSCSS